MVFLAFPLFNIIKGGTRGQGMPAILKEFAHENAPDAGKTMEDAIRMPQKYLRMAEDGKRKYHARERILQEMQREI